MLNFEERQEYYKTSNIILKDYPTWRLYKIQLDSGKWESIRNQIYSVNQLREILIEKSPINVYSSCSTWLNPLKIEHPQYVHADAILMQNDVFIDQDNQDISTYNSILNWFASYPRYKLQRIVNSGEGFHYYYQDTRIITEHDPLKRYKIIKHDREELADEIKQAGLDIDYDVTKDIKRISREIGTLNDGLTPCTIIYDSRMGIGSERRTADEWQTTLAEDRNEARTGPRARSIFQYWYWNFIDVKVEGVKDRYAVFIKKDKNMLSYNKFIRKLSNIQSVYKLSDIYVYETYNTYEAICPKAVPYRRLLKILRFVKSKNYSAFKKYYHYWIRTSAIKDASTTNIIDNTPQLKQILTTDENDNDIYSRPHCNYLNITPKGLLIGNNKNKIKTALLTITKKIKKEDGNS